MVRRRLVVRHEGDEHEGKTGIGKRKYSKFCNTGVLDDYLTKQYVINHYHNRRLYWKW